MDPLKMYFLLKMVIFHCYVSLPEGIAFQQKLGIVIAQPGLRGLVKKGGWKDSPYSGERKKNHRYPPGTPRPTIYKWLFQLGFQGYPLVCWAWLQNFSQLFWSSFGFALLHSWKHFLGLRILRGTKHDMSNRKNPGCLGYIGYYNCPVIWGLFHKPWNKDPVIKQPTSISWKVSFVGFFGPWLVWILCWVQTSNTADFQSTVRAQSKVVETTHRTGTHPEQPLPTGEKKGYPS